MQYFTQSPLTLGTIPAVAAEVHQKEEKKLRSSPKHVTNPQINCYLNELCCYLGSVLIYIGNHILCCGKKDFFYYVTLYAFRVKYLPRVSELNLWLFYMSVSLIIQVYLRSLLLHKSLRI